MASFLLRGLPLALAIACGTLACRTPRPLLADDGWAPPSSPSAPSTDLGGVAGGAVVIPVARRKPWPHFGKASDWEAAPGRDVSDHAGGAFERTVRFDAHARSYLAIAGVRKVPEGAQVLEYLHPIGSERVVAVFAMKKLGKGASNDWSFSILDDQLREAVTGDLNACVGCHAQAPHDGWFGPPRTANGATTQ